MYIYIYILCMHVYIYIYRERERGREPCLIDARSRSCDGWEDRVESVHRHLLETISETANVLDLRQELYTPPRLGGGGV